MCTECSSAASVGVEIDCHLSSFQFTVILQPCFNDCEFIVKKKKSPTQFGLGMYYLQTTHPELNLKDEFNFFDHIFFFIPNILVQA